jgi:peptide-methionine (S)-S-oxide reductase
MLHLFIIILSSLIGSCSESNITQSYNTNTLDEIKYDSATFGAGCFWCVEAQFQALKGVISITSGYSGGTIINPSYQEVCSGNSGHAEVCQIIYDPKIITFDKLLEAFFKSHDPTELNRQGNDIGTQYRSVIFYHNEEQKKQALYYKNQLTTSNIWEKPIVTEISPFTIFYKAENYHQNYYKQHPQEPYCRYVIQPKLDKFRQIFGSEIHE